MNRIYIIVAEYADLNREGKQDWDELKADNRDPLSYVSRNNIMALNLDQIAKADLLAFKDTSGDAVRYNILKTRYGHQGVCTQEYFEEQVAELNKKWL